ncbi:hypothetical protein [Gloeobacter kilaueensis]|uniref:DUF883 domain-containing protein n=1 Tax=Gloeobacter kilaueensis (strain ATCC BAA-2537 / CCAP 1431/1 / ULC 316 / JS1) TaxID=1183438 RepID=U5QDF6_GLOK1|nr:hypothetical protein [Gloeobacter kilaueensis]AGY56962.1 hypothetical protein GKIL_0716 [Gloeobacter kilaueensis JS1]
MENNYADFTSYLHREPASSPAPSSHTSPASEARPESDTAKPAAAAKERIDQAIDAGAKKLRSAAHKLENSAQPGSQTAQLSGKVAEQLHRGAEVLEKTHVDDLTGSVENNIRKQPLLTVGIAFAVGFVLSRLLRR